VTGSRRPCFVPSRQNRGRLESPGGLAQQLGGDLEVHLGRNQRDVPKVLGQQRQTRLDIAAIAVPGEQSVYRGGVPQIVDPWPFGADRATHATAPGDLQKCGAHVWVRASAATLVDEEWRLLILVVAMAGSLAPVPLNRLCDL
jgi:hypothetical protein